jgi:peptide/nickel transport system substrate-binding protein
MPSAVPLLQRCTLFVALVGLGLSGCGRRGGCTGDYCGTLIFVAGADPDILLPPLTQTIAGRDIHDQVFLKLADVGMSTNTVSDEGFEPLLAERWQWEGPHTLVFHLNPRARWHDGRPLTAADVAFTFDAYTDPKVASRFARDLRWISAVTARDSLTAVFVFRRRYPETFYDAVYHMRILPAHLLRAVPREGWKTAPFGRAPVGSGPYRFVAWKAGETIELAADSTFFLGRPHIRRLIWRVAPDLQVAITQLVADQADALEYLGSPDNVRRVQAAAQLTVHTYKGSNYGFLGFNLVANGDTARPHPIFGDREVRRALAMAVDRARLLQSVFGEFGKVPPGPMPQSSWIWDPALPQLPYDTAQAARLLVARGWRDSNGDGIRDRRGEKLAFRLLVPTTSPPRRQYARLLQEQFRSVGAQVEIAEVEGSVFFDRARAAKFDAVLGAWNPDLSPASSIAQTWTRAGFGGSNWLRYANPEFERQVERASTGAGSRDAARTAWRVAIDMLNADAPAVFLYAPDNVAAVHSRVADVRIRPDSWWALVRTWRIPADRLIDRDRVER